MTTSQMLAMAEAADHRSAVAEQAIEQRAPEIEDRIFRVWVGKLLVGELTLAQLDRILPPVPCRRSLDRARALEMGRPDYGNRSLRERI